jgi:hypothetical protein
LEPIQDEITLEPGAQTSTRAPKLEYEALASAMVEAPTVIADGARAGEKPEALALELPAATTVWTPAAVSEETALSREVVAEPPRDMETMEGRPEAAACCWTYWRPLTLKERPGSASLEYTPRAVSSLTLQ